MSVSLAAACATSAAAAGRPERIACLDWGLAETMIALGSGPVGVVGASDWKRFVVQPALPVRTADLGLQQDVNFELIAALRPDLILTSPFLEALEPQLRRIAPILNLSVYDDNGPPLAKRRQVTTVLAQHLGRVEAAQAYLADCEGAFDMMAATLARSPRRPILVTSFLDARHVRVYGATSLYGNVLARLGLKNAWNEKTGFFGYATLGLEALASRPEVLLVTFEPLPPDVRPALARSPLWKQLPFVRAGRVLTLGPTLTFGGLPAARRFARLLTDGLQATSA